MTYRNLISDGSSTMFGTGVGFSFMDVYVSTAAKPINALHNLSVAGSTRLDLIARLPTVTSSLHSGWNGMVCQVGANDLLDNGYADNVTLWASDMVSNYLIPLAAIVRPIILTTLQPRDIPNFNARRNIANTIIRTWISLGYIDGIADFALDPNMGPDGAESNTTYYLDGTHPTALGQTIDGSILKAALDPFVPGDVLSRFSKVRFN